MGDSSACTLTSPDSGTGRELAELWGAHPRPPFDGMDLVKKTPQNLLSVQLCQSQGKSNCSYPTEGEKLGTPAIYLFTCDATAQKLALPPASPHAGASHCAPKKGHCRLPA